MQAPERFVEWLRAYEFIDRNGLLPPGLKLQYHSRSDASSKKLGEFLVDDLLAACEVLRVQAERGEVGFGINRPFTWPNGKKKALDVSLGVFKQRRDSPAPAKIHQLKSGEFARLLVAIEEKSVMTEHGKSQPRLYSELNDSHTIVHQGSQDTIAAGIAVVNIAATFVSPLRPKPGDEVKVTRHTQPEAAANMVRHLRGLPIRDAQDFVGLDAYCTFVVDLDNQGNVALHDTPPAPQPGDSDHYATFVQRMSDFYIERFADIERLAPPKGLSVEDALVSLSAEHPGLLEATGSLAVGAELDGAEELDALLVSIEVRANPSDAMTPP